MANLQRILLRGTFLLVLCFFIGNNDAFGQIVITTPTPLQDGVVGAAYSQTLAATGGTGTRTWTIQSGSLPVGLSLSTAGVISGTPTTTGTASFRVRVQAQSSVGEKDFTLQINPLLTVTTASPMPVATQNGAYSQTLTASGGEGAYAWTITNGSLPNGLSRSGATISGTPTQTGNFTFTVQATDSATPPQMAQKQLTITVVALTITTASPLPDGMTGRAYSQPLSAINGTAPYTWSITSGSLPAGLTVTGVTIAGTPTGTGNSNFTVRVSDSSTPAITAQKNFSLEILAALTITTNSPLPTGSLGVPYSQTLNATGGNNPYTFSVVSGSLPAGLSLSGATISGTPTSVATSNFTIRVTDDNTTPVFTTDKAFTLDIALPPGQPVNITTASPLTTGFTGTTYAQTLAATGGVSPYTWSVVSGALPGGLVLNGATLTGTPTTAGTFNFTIRAADSSSPPQGFQKAFTLSIIAGLSVTTASLAPASTGISYSIILAATGGSPPYTWSILSGALPAGLTLSGPTISGTPTTAGTSNFTVRVVDNGNPQQNAQRALSIVVGPPLSITTSSPLPPGATGNAYSQNLAVTGGTAPYSWSIASGALPTGLTLSSSGALIGTPLQTGAFSITVSVSDASSPPRTATAPFQLTIQPLLTITTPSLPVAAMGASYSTQLAASGDPPLAWSISSGSLPPGITLSTAGLLSGSPTNTGTFGFTVRATSQSPTQEATRTYQIVVNAALSVSTPALPQATRFVPYSTTLAAAGGVPSYSWSVAGGSLPPGLSLSSSGVLSGNPTTVGSSNFTLRVSDASGASATRQFSLSVIQGALRITTENLPAGIQGFAYSHQLVASGGPTPYSWAVTNGSLPAGFSLTSAGVLQGPGSTLFNGTITVRVTDSSGTTDQRDFVLAIVPPLGPITLSGLQTKVAPMQQTAVTLSLASPQPAEVRGTLNLAFASTASIPVNDPAVQFSTGGRSVSFTVPANSTNAVFPSPLLLVSGTVAGTVTITGSIQNGPSGFPLISTGIDATPPQTTNVVATRINGGLSVRVIGFSPDRSVGEVNYAFDVRVNSAIQTVNLARSVTTEFATWYQNPASSAYGSAFRLEQLFGVGGDTMSIEAVTITLRNALGNTTSTRVPFTAN
ncbi:MAG TPA: putative Ig domain-containing protein [Terriglobia bacterium]|nr:putative Ig domain-containing protein [Terriglobia bacterium]